MTIRKDLPFLAFSLAVHAGLLLLLLLWRLPPEPEFPQRRVLLEFRRPAPITPPERGVPRGSRVPPSSTPGRAVPGLAVPEGASLSTPPAAGLRSELPDRRVLASEKPIRLADSPALVAEATGAAAAPIPEQLLRGLADGRTEPAAGVAGAAAGAGPESVAIAGRAGYMQTTALEWEAGERTLLQQPRLGFPKLLLEKGLEVDVEAAFVVAPSGQVVRVEITRSSGFASVDREVQQAMLDALFAESSREDSGRIQFRFRLERKQ